MGEVVAGQAGAGQVGFDAAGAPAVAGRQRQVAGGGRGQRVVAPFAGDRRRAMEQAPMHDDAAADAGTEDGAEHDVGAACRAVGRLGQGEAVGVVGQAYLAAERGLEVTAQRAADQAGRIGVLDRAGIRLGPRDADTDAAACAELAFRCGDQSGHGGDGGRVIAGRGGNAAAQQLAAVIGQRDDLDLGAAEVDAEAQAAQTRTAMPLTLP